MIKAIIVGFGFLGKHSAKAILEQKLPIRVVGIGEIGGYVYDPAGINIKEALELAEEKKLNKHPKWSRGNGLSLIKKAEADVLIEATPTNAKTGEPGYTNIKTALKRGMHVATSNKGPFVTHFRELVQLAQKKGLKLNYDATVGGAIPTISLVKNCIKADKIKRVWGILNGTTNYILSTMYHEGRSFENVLKEAQELGYAEKDPGYDVDGIDAAGKLVILINTLFGQNKKVSDVKITGIRKISPGAMKHAKRKGKVVKLIGYADEKRLEVAPMLVPENHPLNIEGSLNCIYFETTLSGDIIISGRGAGKETIGAILSDVLSCQ